MVAKKLSIDELDAKSKDLRQKVIDFFRKTHRGHIGSNLSIIEILTTLHYNIMAEGDSFILSKGHASGALYVLLNDLGKIPDDVLYTLEEHPKLKPDYGIEASTGSLGHGLSIGLGMAIADREHKTYVLLGDGECDEGQVWEAARLASELKVSNLKAIVDCNGFQGFKSANYENLAKRFEAFGWTTSSCDGHECRNLCLSFYSQNSSQNPEVILAKTLKGKGVSEIENTLRSHYFHF